MGKRGGYDKPLDNLRRNAESAPTVAAQLLTGLNLPITQALQDNTRIGSFYARMLVHVNNTDTIITHMLGRVPSIYIPAGSQVVGGVLSDGSANRADWTASRIVLRASNSGLYSFLIA